MDRKRYLTDLTDEQWEILETLIPPAKPGGRPRTVDAHGWASLPGSPSRSDRHRNAAMISRQSSTRGGFARDIRRGMNRDANAGDFRGVCGMVLPSNLATTSTRGVVCMDLRSSRVAITTRAAPSPSAARHRAAWSLPCETSRTQPRWAGTNVGGSDRWFPHQRLCRKVRTRCAHSFRIPMCRDHYRGLLERSSPAGYVADANSCDQRFLTTGTVVAH